MRIRPAVPADHPAIAKLWHDSARSMDGGIHDVPAVAALQARLDREVAGGWHIAIADDGDEPAGFAAIDPQRGILHQLFVAPTRQRHGIGSALLDVAKVEMPKGFTLHTPVSNRMARDFYAGHGLRHLGDGRHPVSDTAIGHHAWTPPRSSPPDSSAEIYLLRHGETEWNAAGRFQGRRDSALTARGEAQAAASARRLASLINHVDAVHASPLGRVRRTCEAVSAIPAFPPISWDDRLLEVSFGAWEGLTMIDIEASWPGRLDGASPSDWYFRAPDGESHDEAAARVRSWLADIRGTVVAVSHGLLGRIIRGEYLGLPRADALALPAPHDMIWRLADGRVEGFRS